MKRVHTIKITERMVDAGVREIEDYDCRDTSRNRDTVLRDVMGGRLDEFLMAALIEESCATTLDKSDTVE